MSEEPKELQRYRLAWNDGVVIEKEAASLGEAIIRCGKGEPYTWDVVAKRKRIVSMVEHQGQLYLATERHVYIYDKGLEKFRKLEFVQA